MHAVDWYTLEVVADNREALDCVMPAAGESTRMGEWKLLLPLGSRTVIEQSVRNALSVCSRVILVTGYRAAELHEIFNGWQSVITVDNPEYSFGMFSSIRAGVRIARGNRFFIALADMPLIPPEIYGALSELKLPTAGLAAARPFCHSMKGHPVLLTAGLIDKILRFDNSHSMQDVLQGVPMSRVETQVEGVLQDLDTPEDYRALSSVQ